MKKNKKNLFNKKSKQSLFSKDGKMVSFVKKNKAGVSVVLGLIFIIGFSILISNLTTPEGSTISGETNFKNISYKEYEALFEEDQKGLVFVYVGNPTCGYCQKIEPLLGALEIEESIQFNYLNTATMSPDDFNNISKTSKAFEGEWGTPTLVAIINGEEHSNVNGYREINELREFVKAAKSEMSNE